MGGKDLTTLTLPAQETSEHKLEEVEVFHLLADEAKDYAIIILDPVGRVIQWNSGAQRLKGYSAEEIVGKSLTQFYTPEDIAQGKPLKALEKAAAEGRYEEEGWRVRKGGQRYWADVVITALHDKSGQVIGFSKLVRDQTEHKKIEEALHASQLSYRQLVMLLPVAVYTTDMEGTVTLYNRQAVELFGREPQIGRDRWCGSFRLYKLDGSLLPPDQCPMAIALKESRSVRGEEIILERPDGSRAYVLPCPELIRDASGATIGAVNVLIDLTGRRDAEKALRESESFLRVLIDNLPFEFWARNREGRCTMQNREIVGHWGNILGKVPEENALSPEEAARWASNNKRAYNGQTIQGEAEYLVGGEKRIFHEIVAPVRVDDEIRGILGLNIDITEQKKAEIALRRSEQQLRVFIEEAPVAIAMFDKQMRYLAASARWLSEHGLSGNVIGKSHYEMSPQMPDGWKEVHHRCMAGAVERCDEDVFVRPDGVSNWLKWEVRPWRTNSGDVGGIVIFTENISERKLAEEALRQNAANLEKEVAKRTAALRTTIAELEAFSYSVSHDLRSPLRAMQGYSQALLEDYADRLDEQGRIYLRRIDRASGRLDRLVQDILTYSRVARADLPLGTVNLEVLIDDVVQNYPAFQEPRAEITIQRPILHVIGNEGSLMQCVSNLLANAVKFVPPNTVPKIKVWTEAVGSDVRLWIEDNGIGIEDAHFERIFQIFGRVHPDEKFEGTGIGLSIVKKAVERMGGSLGLESQVGQGSRFWVQLPGGRNNDRAPNDTSG